MLKNFILWENLMIYIVHLFSLFSKILWRKQFTIHANYKKQLQIISDNKYIINNGEKRDHCTHFSTWNPIYFQKFFILSFFSLTKCTEKKEKKRKEENTRTHNIYGNLSRKRLFSTQSNWIQFNAFFLREEEKTFVRFSDWYSVSFRFTSKPTQDGDEVRDKDSKRGTKVWARKMWKRAEQ